MSKLDLLNNRNFFATMLVTGLVLTIIGDSLVPDIDYSTLVSPVTYALYGLISVSALICFSITFVSLGYHIAWMRRRYEEAKEDA